MLWRNPAVRLLLLVLAFGVAGMHTLGHHEGHEPAATGSGHGVAAGAVGHSATADPAGHADAVASAVHAVAASTGPALTSPTGELDPSQMCLAILTAGALLGLIMAAGRTRRRVPLYRWRPHPRATGRADRGPPRLLPTNLLLTEIAVLRI